MKFKIILGLLLIISLTSCAIITDEYQVNQRKVIAYLLEDLPLPTDADIIKAPSVLLGTGNAISGRIVLTSGFSPAENLIFYGNRTPSTGWQLLSSKVGHEITLVYSKNGRKFLENFKDDFWLDLKINDIPKTALSAINSVKDLKKCKYITVHANGGLEMLKAIKKESKKRKIDPAITNTIWKSMIRAYIDYEYRNFKKK